MLFAALLYHALGDTPKSTYLNPGSFREQLALLHDEGFVIEGFAGLSRRLHDNIWPDRYVVMAFDDGHITTLRAAEMLAAIGGTASAFIMTHAAQSNYIAYMGPAELRQLSAVFDIGSHSVTHAPLTRLPDPQLHCELRDSKLWLEDVLGNPVSTFSCPGGYINRRVRDAAHEAGYNLIGTSIPKPNRAASIRQDQMVHRIEIKRGFATSTLRKIINFDPAYFASRQFYWTGLSALQQALTIKQLDDLRRFARRFIK
jgi:peptidoglycan/xylan/chitin deacetylase (PgdA/CDA1 family)